MIINWYGILFGNGLEIRKQPKLRSERIRATMLAVEKSNLGKDKNKTALIKFPFNILNFVKESNLDNETKDCISSISNETWDRIKAVINNSDPRNSIERFFIEVETQIYEKKERSSLKKAFLAYINMCSLETKIENTQEEIFQDGEFFSGETNEILKRIEGNDSILTTNYTNFIERHGVEANKITYLHGEYNNPENLPLLGSSKFGDITKVVNQVMNNIEKKFNVNKFKKSKKRINLNLSIFGWSPSEEYELIWVIIFKILHLTKGSFIFYKGVDFSPFYSFNTESIYARDSVERLAIALNELKRQFPNTDVDFEQINDWNININYYYFDKDKDIKNFKTFVENSPFFITEKVNDSEILGKVKLGFSEVRNLLGHALILGKPEDWFLNEGKSTEKIQVIKELNCFIKLRPSEEFWGNESLPQTNHLQGVSLHLDE